MFEEDASTAFLDGYAQHVTEVLNPTYSEARALFRAFRQPDYWAKYEENSHRPTPSPVQRVHCQVKRPESVLDKVLRKPDRFPAGLDSTSFTDMADTLGVRIVVFFPADLVTLDKEIRQLPNLEISKKTKPVAYLPEACQTRHGLDHVNRRFRQKVCKRSGGNQFSGLPSTSVVVGNAGWGVIPV